MTKQPKKPGIILDALKLRIALKVAYKTDPDYFTSAHLMGAVLRPDGILHATDGHRMVRIENVVDPKGAQPTVPIRINLKEGIPENAISVAIYPTKAGNITAWVNGKQIPRVLKSSQTWSHPNEYPDDAQIADIIGGLPCKSKHSICSIHINPFLFSDVCEIVGLETPRLDFKGRLGIVRVHLGIPDIGMYFMPATQVDTDGWTTAPDDMDPYLPMVTDKKLNNLRKEAIAKGYKIAPKPLPYAIKMRLRHRKSVAVANLSLTDDPLYKTKKLVPLRRLRLYGLRYDSNGFKPWEARAKAQLWEIELCRVTIKKKPLFIVRAKSGSFFLYSKRAVNIGAIATSLAQICCAALGGKRKDDCSDDAIEAWFISLVIGDQKMSGCWRAWSENLTKRAWKLYPDTEKAPTL